MKAHKRHVLLGLLVAGFICGAVHTPAEAVELYFSLSIDNIIDGIEYDRNDIVKYDTATNAHSLFFDGDTVFNSDREDIDAFSILSGGDLVLSTTKGAGIGGLSFQDDDLVRVNPVTHAASLFLDGGTLFKKNEELRAVDVFPDGKIIFGSSNGDVNDLGGTTLPITNKDLVLFDPITGDASLYFDGSEHFDGKKGEIKGVDVLPDGKLVLIVWGDSGRQANLGGVDIGRRDIVLYDPSTKQLTVLLNGDDIFERTGHQHDQGFDAVFVPDAPPPVVPEPFSMSLFGLGLAGIGISRRRRRAV